jgi:hypothetical protein
MWLPSWIGMNPILIKEVGEHMQSKAVGKELTTDMLDELDLEVRAFLCQRFPNISGLDRYLDGLVHVSLDGDEQET